MDHKDCDHSNCTGASCNASVCQTLSEMDWERGVWNAAYNGDQEKVQSLIDKAKNAIEIVTATDNAGYTALHYAARNGFINICKLLLQNGADVNAKTKSAHATPLHKAAAAGQLASVRFLISNGAKVDIQDVDGETILHKAVHSKNNDLVTELLQAYPILQNIKDHKGRLPLANS